MSVKEIIGHFEKSSGDVIFTEDVCSEITRRLASVTIVHKAVDVPEDVLRGMFLGSRLLPQMQESVLMPIREMTIIYSSRQPIDYQRLVLCKEFIHCMDSEAVKTKTFDEALALCDELTNGEDTISPEGDTVLQAAIDELAKFQALAILFPMRLRIAYEPAFKNDGLSIKEIAKRVILPEEYVGMVMSSKWPTMYNTLLAL